MKTLQDISIQFVKGVGPARKKTFQQLGVETVEDLLYFFPRRHEDRTRMTPILDVRTGEWQTVSGVIRSVAARKSWHTRKHVCEIVVDDGQGRIQCVWFNRPYLDKYLKPEQRIVLYGKVDTYKNKLQMVSPEYEIIAEGDENLSTGRIVPVYPLTRGITQRYLRKVMNACLERYANQVLEILPYDLRAKYRLDNIARSLLNIHFPESEALQKQAMERVSFEEFFMFSISVTLRRMRILQKKGIAHTIEKAAEEKFAGAFPFSLTGAQKRVISEISEDMRKSSPMLRLLQGDVGSGKTLAAFWGAVVAFQNKCQSALMAPTEILARQHVEVLTKMIQGTPYSGMRIALLVSSLKKPERDKLYKAIHSGEINLVVGTHALIQEDLKFKNLSYVIIDEQHKFGVRQRALLPAKGENPDVLIMTATPIPRTLCLTLYGDLDLSVIDEMPPGRGKVATRHFPEEKVSEAYALLQASVLQGQQAYIIYPIIEESETLEVKSAEAMFRHFQKNEFKKFRLGLIHGKMDKEKSEKIMMKFKKHEIDILVATSVLEVGVDVPNANVMVVEHAERFGLSQLHQLRGRIGRGKSDAQCLLVSDMATQGAQARMEALLSSNDGFKIAQQDLMIRGPGQFFGRHQHGLNELKVANPATQLDLLEHARKEARSLLKDDPRLRKPDHSMIRQVVRKRYPTYLNMVEAG